VGGPTAAIPHTRGSADTDGTTQLIEAPANKRRSLAPVAAGVVVILAAGGAWMVMSGGQKGNAVSPDTAVLVNRDSGIRTAARPRPTGIDPARAGDILEGLIESTPAVIRDSATKVFNTAGVVDSNKAFAACMIAQAEQGLSNRASALRWADTGLRRNPSLTSCQNVVQTLRP
jgi:hypothetical protein